MPNCPDPYLVPAFPLPSRLLRAAWGVVQILLFRPSPRPCHRWRAFLLRCFGAHLGANVHIYPRAAIWAPWNLVCADTVAIADDAVIYNPSLVSLGSHATISQQAYLCGATHAYEDAAFPLLAFPISICAHAWICARATVQAGVQVGEGAVLALGSVATRDLDPWTVYGGIPAARLKSRTDFTASPHPYSQTAGEPAMSASTDNALAIASQEFLWSGSETPEAHAYLLPPALAALREFERHTVLDLGCGNGAGNRAHCGFDGFAVSGCDASESGLALARQAHPRAGFFLARYRHSFAPAPLRTHTMPWFRSKSSNICCSPASWRCAPAKRCVPAGCFC